MDFQALYQSKLTTAAEAAKLVKSGDWVGLHLVHQPPRGAGQGSGRPSE